MFVIRGVLNRDCSREEDRVLLNGVETSSPREKQGSGPELAEGKSKREAVPSPTVFTAEFGWRSVGSRNLQDNGQLCVDIGPHFMILRQL